MKHIKVYENLSNIPNVLSRILMMRKDIDTLMNNFHDELNSNKTVNPDYLNQIIDLQMKINQLKNNYNKNILI